MKHTAALFASLVLLLLTTPLLAAEAPASPGAERLTTESITLPFMSPAAHAAPLQCTTSSILFPDLGMTAKECVQVCGGCCACAQTQGTRCIDWECC
jgi:hypothetical protein